MPKRETPEAAATEETRLADEGFTVESASAKDAFELPPDDTTLRAAEEPQEPANEDDESPSDETVTESAGDGESSAVAAEAGDEGDTSPDTPTSDESTTDVSAATEEEPAKKTRAQKRRERQQAKYIQVDTERRQAEAALEAQRQENAELKRRLDALEAAQAPRPPAVETPKAPETPVQEPPPKLSDFETEEAFQTANTAWLQKQVRAAQEQVTAGVDAKLTEQRQTTEAVAQQEALRQRMVTMIESHPDFAERASANAEALSRIQSNGFVEDVVINTPRGPELLYACAGEPELAAALSALPIPSRPLREAVVSSDRPDDLMTYFATPEGFRVYQGLRQQPSPLAVIRSVAAIEARLEAARGGSTAPSASTQAPGPETAITTAVPPARPPSGTPRARVTAVSEESIPLEDLVDLRERQARNKRRVDAGLPPV